MKVTGLERVRSADRTLADYQSVGGVFAVRGNAGGRLVEEGAVAVLPAGLGVAYFLREHGVTHSAALGCYVVIGEVKEIEVK